MASAESWSYESGRNLRTISSGSSGPFGASAPDYTEVTAPDRPSRRADCPDLANRPDSTIRGSSPPCAWRISTMDGTDGTNGEVRCPDRQPGAGRTSWKSARRTRTRGPVTTHVSASVQTGEPANLARECDRLSSASRPRRHGDGPSEQSLTTQSTSRTDRLQVEILGDLSTGSGTPAAVAAWPGGQSRIASLHARLGHVDESRQFPTLSQVQRRRAWTVELGDKAATYLARQRHRRPASAARPYLARKPTEATHAELAPILSMSRSASVPELTTRFSGWLKLPPQTR